jgi:hypothetical protein
MFPSLTAKQQARVVDEVRRFVELKVERGLDETAQLETVPRLS